MSQPAIFAAYSKSMGTEGLAIRSTKMLYSSVIQANSFMVKGDGFEVAPKAEDEVYFFQLKLALDFDKKALSVEKLDSLIILNIVELVPLHLHGLNVACFDKSYGLVFSSQNHFLSCIKAGVALFDNSPDDMVIPLPGNNELLFLSLDSLVLGDLSLLKRIQRSQAMIFPSNISLKIPNETDTKEYYIERHSTPFLSREASKCARRSTRSEGATTIASDSLSPNSQDGFQPLSVHSNDQSCLYKGDEDKSYDENIVSHITDRHYPSDLSIDIKVEKKTKIKINEQLFKIPGPFDKVLSTKFSQSGPDKLRHGKDMFNSSWYGMKNSLGWTHDWKKVNDIVGTLNDVYVVPGCDKKQGNRVQNLEYFEQEDFYFHLAANPCITEEWRDLWPRLQSFGWEATSPQKVNFESALPVLPTSIVYYYSKAEYQSKPLPGLNIFYSKLAVVQFIARCPYALQDDFNLIGTARRFGWKVKGDGKNAKLQGPTETDLWINLAELRHLIFTSPQALFRQFWTDIGENYILNMLKLPESMAIQPDLEPCSPEVDGMSRAERDRRLNDIRKYVDHIEGVEYKKMISLLEPFGWTYSRAAWSTKWWKHEQVFRSNYSNQNEINLIFGKDYFFEAKHVATFLSIDLDRVFLPPLGNLRAHELSRFDDFDEVRFTLKKRLRKIASDYTTTQAFKLFHLHDMLKDDGWVISGQCAKEEVFIPPAASLRGVSLARIKSFQAGVDYFNLRSEVLGYLMCGEQPIADSAEICDEDTISSINDTSESLKIEHTIPNSTEAVLMDLIANKSTSFKDIYGYLKVLGWKSLYVKGNADRVVICRPSMLSRARELNLLKNSAIDICSFIENNDYFDDDSRGRETLLVYLRRHGIHEQSFTRNEVMDVKEKKASYSTKVPNNSEGLQTSGNINPLPSKDVSLLVLSLLSEEATSFKDIYGYLKVLGWKSLYVKGNADRVVICRPSMLSRARELNLLKNSAIDICSFIENNDYFDDDSRGRETLLVYLRRHGIHDQVSDGLDINQDSLIIHARSPARPLYKAADPETHDYRLSDQACSDTPMAKSEKSLEEDTFDDDCAILEEGEDEEAKEACFDEEDANELIFAPNSQLIYSRKGLVSEESDMTLRDMIADSLKFPFEKIFSYLRKQHGWSYVYFKRTYLHLLSTDAKIAPGSVVYLRGGCTVNSEGMSRGLDFFYTEGSVMKFLRSCFGSVTSSSAPDSASHHRGTRSGKVLMFPIDNSDNCLELEGNISDDCKDWANEIADIGNTDRSSKRRRLSHQVKIETSSSFDSMSLSDGIKYARQRLCPSTNSETRSYPVPLRESESKELFRLTATHLSKGHGGVLYACGGTGCGKTLVINSVIEEIERLRDNKPEFMDAFRVVRIKGCALDGFSVLDIIRQSYFEAEVISSSQPTPTISRSLTIGSSKSDAVQDFKLRLAGRGRSCSGLFDIDLLSPSKDTSSVDSPAQSIDTRKNKLLSPLCLLVVQELDNFNPSTLAEVISVACSPASSLLIIASGNSLNPITKTHPERSFYTIPFKPYTRDSLIQLVFERAGSLFDSRALNFLAIKTMSANYRADPRKILGFADSLLDLSSQKLSSEELAGPIKPVVFLENVTSFFKTGDSATSDNLRVNLPQLQRTLLVSLFLAGLGDSVTFGPRDALNAFLTQCDLRNIPPENFDTISQTLEYLCDAQLIKRLQNRKTLTYRIDITAETLLLSGCMSQIESSDLRRLISNTKEEVTSVEINNL